MSYAIPDPRYEELLPPGVKPVGNVVIDWDHPLADGLIAQWVFTHQQRGKDLVAGNDIMDNFINTPELNVGQNGTGLYLADNEGSYSDSTGHMGRVTDQFSIVFDVDILASSSVSNFMFGQTTVGTSNYDWGLYLAASNNRFTIFFTTSAGLKTISPLETFTIGNNYKLVLTYDGANIRFYRNNVANGSNTQTGNVSVTASQKTGFDIWNGSELNLRIYNASLYNKALSVADIDSLYRNPYQHLIPA